ncbi:hypothetical protein D3C80_1640040 [compost metagenome]
MQLAADFQQLIRHAMGLIAARCGKWHVGAQGQLAHDAEVNPGQMPRDLPLAVHRRIHLLLRLGRLAAGNRLLPGQYPRPRFTQLAKRRCQDGTDSRVGTGALDMGTHRHLLR